MKKIARFLFLFVASILFFAKAFAQVGAVTNYCNLGAAQAKTSGLQSSNYLQGVVPSCTVTVYLSGTTTPATIYADPFSTPLTNPFTATTVGQWIFYAAINQSYDIVLSGGVPPNVYTTSVTILNQFSGSNTSINTGTVGCSPTYLTISTLGGCAGVSTLLTNTQTMNGPLAWTGGNTGTPAVTTLANLGGMSIAGGTITGSVTIQGQLNSSQTELNNINPSGSVVSIKNFNASGWLETPITTLITNPTPTASTASVGSTATFSLSASWHLMTGEITVKVGSGGTAFVGGPGFSPISLSAMATLLNANPSFISQNVVASVSGINLILTGPIGASGSKTLVITGTVLNELIPIATTASLGSTSITLNQTCLATGFDATNASVQYGYQQIYIAGAGTSGANYIGTVSECIGSTATITPATSTSVTNAVVHHDETNAFQSAITSLASTGGKITIPNGYYRINGPLQDTSYANAIIEWPQLPYLNNPVNLPAIAIELSGTSLPTAGCTDCTVIQTDQPSGNMFGAYNYTAGGSQPFTNINAVLSNLLFRAYPNQSITLFDGSNLTGLIAKNVLLDTGAGQVNIPSPQWPTSTNGNGILYPHIGNGVTNIADNVWTQGMYYGLVTTEHTTVLFASGNTNHDGIVFDGGTTSPSYFSGNGISVVSYWCQGCYHTATVVSPSFVTALRIDSEEGSTGYTDWYDPSGYGHGTATIYSIEPPQIVNASADMQIHSCYILNYLSVPCTDSASMTRKSYIASIAALNQASGSNGQIAGNFIEGIYLGTTTSTASISAGIGASRQNPNLASSGNDYTDGVGINISGFWQGVSTGVPLYLGYSYNGTSPWLTINNGIATALTGLQVSGDSTFSAAPRGTASFNTGLLTATPLNQALGSFMLAKSATLENITGTAATLTCSSNPTINLIDCGTTAGSCSPGTIIASVLISSTLTNSGTIVSSTITAAHSYLWTVQSPTQGTCTALNMGATAEYRIN